MTPYQDINRNIHNKVIYESWPNNRFAEIDDIEEIKDFYNKCYNNLHERLEKELQKFHPASLIIEAYKQLELWTVIYYKEAPDNVIGHYDFAPIGRYGWRYVIEMSLERMAVPYTFEELRPNAKNLNNIFTCLLGMGQCSEFSNYLHFLKDKLTSAKIIFSPQLIAKQPQFSDSDELFFENIKKTIFSKPDWDKYQQFSYNSPILSNKVNDFLRKHFSITISEVQNIIDVIINKISLITKASITVQPYDDFIDLIEELSHISREKIKSLVELSFLHVDKSKITSRDFLRKNQQNRMLFNAGVLLQLDSHLETIYDLISANKSFVKESRKHIIISPRLLAEWLDVFVFKIVLGQRTDLKEDAKYKQDIADIESFYRIKIFEVEVTNLLTKKNFYCLNLNKVNGQIIECGEIDLIAYNSGYNQMYVVECKAYAPIVDARGLGQVFNDHYKQKKYHQKFLKKINWVKSNRKVLNSLFSEKFGITLSSDYILHPFFITGANSALQLIEDKYKIMTFYEFDNYLDDEYR